MELYSYFRSTAAYRVRAACALKKIDYDLIPVHLVKNGGEQHSEAYLKQNPQGLVPSLKDGDISINQSLAILEYLDEKYPDTYALLPNGIEERAYVRELSTSIACDIHPLNNLRVLKYLTGELSISEQDKNKWYHHWILIGFKAIEKKLQQSAYRGKCCFGDEPTMADCCLIPQVYNANRFECPLDEFPLIQEINSYCLSLAAFKVAAPEAQPDATSTQ